MRQAQSIRQYHKSTTEKIVINRWKRFAKYSSIYTLIYMFCLQPLSSTMHIRITSEL
ncbi:hypothetical protein Hanom_Chr09g00821731 [Helianthus anomalus]